MRMSLVATVCVLSLSGAALAQDRQTVTGPRTVYWMDVTTNSGIAGMDPMQAMMGGGGGGTTVHLEIASQDPSGRRTEATHTVPAGARIGPDLRLEGEDRRGSAPEDGLPGDYEQPRGRLFLFYGCGETAPRGQPVVIDFALAWRRVRCPRAWKAVFGPRRRRTRRPAATGRVTPGGRKPGAAPSAAASPP